MKDIEAMLSKEKKMVEPKETDYLSTGSTLINLACTGTPHGGFLKGKYYFLVGDSSSGKTFLSLTCLAEASINPDFARYRFIYDNAEDGALMDVQKFFGKGTAKRIEPPSGDRESPIYSSSIEDFYFHLDDAIQEDVPFIYILDSMDSLSSKSEDKKFQETKDAARKGKETAGSYGDGKAKKNSVGLRRVLPHLSKTGSILLIINQTRDNIGFGFEKKTRSGGNAQRFYATVELWSSIVGKIKKTVNGKPRTQGIVSKVQLKKNRITGKDISVEIPILYSVGIDDLGSCVRYLLNERHWKRSKGRINAVEFDVTGSKEKIIRHVEENELEEDLRDIVFEVWADIDEKTAVKRRRRYD